MVADEIAVLGRMAKHSHSRIKPSFKLDNGKITAVVINRRTRTATRSQQGKMYRNVPLMMPVDSSSLAK